MFGHEIRLTLTSPYPRQTGEGPPPKNRRSQLRMARLQGKSDAPCADGTRAREGLLAFLPRSRARIQPGLQFFRRNERCGGDGLPEGCPYGTSSDLEDGNRQENGSTGCACFWQPR